MPLALNKPKLDNLAGDIWKSAERLRGKFKVYEYQSVILPIIVIRRLECVLIKWRCEKSAEILAKRPKLTEKELAKLVKSLEISTAPFSNKTNWTLRKVYEEDHTLLEENFRALHQRLLEERRRHNRALQLPGDYRSGGEEQPPRPDPEPIQGIGARPRQVTVIETHLTAAA